jgi:hypothetical protein
LKKYSTIGVTTYSIPVIFKGYVKHYKVMLGLKISHSKRVKDHSTIICSIDNNITRKSIRPLKLGHLMALNIKENDDQISGFLSMEFDYYSYDGRIKYRDIYYSNPRLIKHIEGNPRVMKNIDSYLRRNLLESEYGFKF